MNIISKILHKWFDLEPDVCPSCEVLQAELAIVRRDNEHLLYKLLSNPEEPPPMEVEEPQVIRRSQFIPARVRQQFAEENDRKSLSLMQSHKKQMEELKKNTSSISTPETSIEKLEEQVLGGGMGLKDEKDFETVYDEIKTDTVKSL